MCIRDSLDRAVVDDVDHLTFLDLDKELVERELEREARTRRSGAPAENMIRDMQDRVNAKLDLEVSTKADN